MQKTVRRGLSNRQGHANYVYANSHVLWHAPPSGLGRAPDQSARRASMASASVCSSSSVRSHGTQESVTDWPYTSWSSGAGF